MKKGLISVFIIVLILGGAWYALHRNRADTTVVNTPSANAGHPNPSNATFDIDDQMITLKNGTSDSVSLTNVTGYGDINGDGKEDAAFFLAAQNPISGTLSIYLAAYVSGPVEYKSTNTVAIGLQIIPQSVSIKNGDIVVTYLDRKASDPLTAEPTILTTKTIHYASLDNTIE